MDVKVDDVEALQKDLQKDFVIKSTLSSVAGDYRTALWSFAAGYKRCSDHNQALQC